MDEKGALNLSKRISKELKKKNFTESMYVIGSLSTGHFDKFGDIDIVITTNKKIGSKDVLPVIKKFMTKEDYEKYSKVSEEQFPYRVDPKINGIKIMLFFILEDWILHNLNRYQKIRKDEYSEYANIIRTKKSKILFDKKGKLRNTIKKIPDFPSYMRKHVLNERIHKLNFFLFLDNGAINTERKRKNLIEIQFIFGEVINNIYECVYALNNKIMTDRKWAPEEIKKFKKKPKNLIKRLERVSKKGNSKKEIDQKINSLRKITKELKYLVEKENIQDLPELKLPKKSKYNHN